MGLARVTGPAEPAVDLAYVKTKLRVEHDEHDVIITSLIAGAQAYAEGDEGFTGCAFIDQTWDYFLDRFPRRHEHTIEMPLPPLIEIVEFKYQDANGDEQDVDADLYAVDTARQPGRIVLLRHSSWPVARKIANAVRIRFRAGYLDQTVSPAVSAVPEDTKLGLSLRVAADYGPYGDDAAAKIRLAADLMLRGKRKQLGMA